MAVVDHCNTEQVWTEFSEYVRNFVRTKVSNEDDVSDLVQDIYLKIHTNLSSLNDTSKLASWVFAISRNVINDYYREASKELDQNEFLKSIEQEGYEELLECIRPMIEALPEPYSSALIWTELEGKKQVDLAKKEGISVSAAKSRVQRGRLMFKQQLKECCNFELNEYGQVKEGWDPDICNWCEV